MVDGSPTRTQRRRTPPASSSTFPTLCSSSFSPCLLLDHVVVVALHPAARAEMAGVGSPGCRAAVAFDTVCRCGATATAPIRPVY